MSTAQQFIVESRDAKQRLDLFCVAHLPVYSRAALQRAIKDGQIRVNGEVVKPKHILVAGDAVTAAMTAPESVTASTAVDAITLPILFEDKDVVVINKPPGIAVHPGLGLRESTVADWFAARYPGAQGVGENAARPGIVHRLDKDTSGVLILAKTAPAYAHLKAQFQRRHAKKEYLALIFGIPTGLEGRINRALARSSRNPRRRTIDPAGKDAITEWQLEQKFLDRFSLLRVQPLTGRMHQIRVHMHFLGHPVVGDSLYTFKRQKAPAGVTRQLLHAAALTLTLPSGGTKRFEAPLPPDFLAVLTGLGYDVP